VRLRDHVGRMPHVLVAFVLVRPDLVRRELPGELPQRLLLLRETERDPRPLLDADHRRLPCRLTSQSTIPGAAVPTPGDRRLSATPPTRTSAKAATRRPPARRPEAPPRRGRCRPRSAGRSSRGRPAPPTRGGSHAGRRAGGRRTRARDRRGGRA